MIVIKGNAAFKTTILDAHDKARTTRDSFVHVTEYKTLTMAALTVLQHNDALREEVESLEAEIATRDAHDEAVLLEQETTDRIRRDQQMDLYKDIT